MKDTEAREGKEGKGREGKGRQVFIFNVVSLCTQPIAAPCHATVCSHTKAVLVLLVLVVIIVRVLMA